MEHPQQYTPVKIFARRKREIYSTQLLVFFQLEFFKIQNVFWTESIRSLVRSDAFTRQKLIVISNLSRYRTKLQTFMAPS
jgi:hypothetical protein